jgi:hypothetical protein
MRSIKVIMFIASAFLAQSVFAQESPGNTPSPFGDIQAQLDVLAARTEALENSAPTSDVEGRSYCFTLNLLILRGRANSTTEELQTNVIRRTATFSEGMFTGPLVSNVLNNQLDNGTVTLAQGDPIDPLLATYTQSGNKLGVTFTNGTTANWYVSNDGSVIHGTAISNTGPIGPGGVITVGFLRTWTLIEKGLLDTCDAEDQ